MSSRTLLNGLPFKWHVQSPKLEIGLNFHPLLHSALVCHEVVDSSKTLHDLYYFFPGHMVTNSWFPLASPRGLISWFPLASLLITSLVPFADLCQWILFIISLIMNVPNIYWVPIMYLAHRHGDMPRGVSSGNVDKDSEGEVTLKISE